MKLCVWQENIVLLSLHSWNTQLHSPFHTIWNSQESCDMEVMESWGRKQGKGKKIQLPGKVVYKCAQIFTRCQKRERIGACSSHLYTSLSGRWVCVCVCALDRDPRNVYSGWVLKPEITWYLERNFIVFRLPRNNLKPSVKMSIEQTKKATMTIFSKTRRWQ